MTRLDRCLNVYDLRDAAKRRLPKGVFDFVDRATEDHLAVANNRSAFERIKLRHRALVDVSGRSVATTLFGKPASVNVLRRPTWMGHGRHRRCATRTPTRGRFPARRTGA